MALNIGNLLVAAKTVSASVAAHPITKGGALAALIVGGIQIAILAGIAIPSWAVAAGPVAGYILYKLLPPKVEAEIDDTATKVVDIANTVPVIDPTYNISKNKPNL